MESQNLTNAVPGNYEVLKVLGQGCFGQVFKCCKKDTKETVAVKVFKKKHTEHENIREVFIAEILRRCLDPNKSNIVKYYESFHKIDRTFMVCELLDMSVHEYRSQNKWAPLPLNGIKIIIKDLATALHALKDIGLIHTDLKLDNVMLVNHARQPFRVKLIDFGLAIQLFEARPGLTVQPLWYRSPEIILGSQFTEAIDVWSLGTALAEMLLGFPLFPGKSEYDVLYFITNLLGQPPTRLLTRGLNTFRFYRKSHKLFVAQPWRFKTPTEFFLGTGIRTMDITDNTSLTVDDLKNASRFQKNDIDPADWRMAIELLERMIEMDPSKRITPKEIIAHPFISQSNSPRNKSAATEPSQAVKDTKDTKETTDDDSPQAVQTKMIDWIETTEVEEFKLESESSCGRPDSGDLVLESISDDDFTLSSSTDSSSTSEVSENSLVEAPDSAVNQAINSHTSGVGPPEKNKEKKKKKKKKGIRRFLSALKRKIFCCFHVPDDDDEARHDSSMPQQSASNYNQLLH